MSTKCPKFCHLSFLVTQVKRYNWSGRLNMLFNLFLEIEQSESPQFNHGFHSKVIWNAAWKCLQLHDTLNNTGLDPAKGLRGVTRNTKSSHFMRGNSILQRHLLVTYSNILL